jgi:hypothetical protein
MEIHSAITSMTNHAHPVALNPMNSKPDMETSSKAPPITHKIIGTDVDAVDCFAGER